MDEERCTDGIGSVLRVSTMVSLTTISDSAAQRDATLPDSHLHSALSCYPSTSDLSPSSWRPSRRRPSEAAASLSGERSDDWHWRETLSNGATYLAIVGSSLGDAEECTGTGELLGGAKASAGSLAWVEIKPDSP